MGIDKFGRSVSLSKNISAPAYVKHQCIPNTRFNDYDIQNKKLCNVQHPSESLDAANKLYVDSTIDSTIHEIDSKILHIENKLTKKIIDEVNNMVTFKSDSIHQTLEELKGESTEFSKSVYIALQKSIVNNQENIKKFENLLSHYNIGALTKRLEKLEVAVEKRKISPQLVIDGKENEETAKKSKTSK